MTELIIATRNNHKVQEIRAVLPTGIQVRTLRDFPGVPEVTEDQNTFTGNATKKAVTVAHWLASRPDLLVGGHSGQPDATDRFCLADDSGLEVDALQGAPGIHSARFANLDEGFAGNSADSANNAKLLRLLAHVPPERRTARFRCVIALTPITVEALQTASPVCYADEAELQTQIFEGVCEGHIMDAPRGAQGFGYDPLFVPAGLEQSFAELGEETKNRISHRARALMKLNAFFARINRG